jgi:hypothetical protein
MDNHYEEDAELQAAIALSLGLLVPNNNNNNNNDKYHITTTNNNNNTTSTTTTTPIPMEIDENHDDDDNDEDKDRKLPAQNHFSQSIPKLAPPPPCLPNPQHFSGRVRRWYSTSSTTGSSNNNNNCGCNVADIHNILWDSSIVTLSQDQQRWVSQGIQFKEDGGVMCKDNHHHDHNDNNNNNNKDNGTNTVNSTIRMGQNTNHTLLSSSKMSLLWKTVITNHHGMYN